MIKLQNAEERKEKKSKEERKKVARWKRVDEREGRK